MSEERTKLQPKSLCERCRSKLVHKAKFKQHEPWMMLEFTTTLILVGRALDDNKFHIKYGSDITGINRIECLGCFLPKVIDECIEVAKSDKTLSKLVALQKSGNLQGDFV